MHQYMLNRLFSLRLLVLCVPRVMPRAIILCSRGRPYSTVGCTRPRIFLLSIAVNFNVFPRPVVLRRGRPSGT